MNQTILRCFFIISNVWFVENMYTLFNFPKNWSFLDNWISPTTNISIPFLYFLVAYLTNAEMP